MRILLSLLLSCLCAQAQKGLRSAAFVANLNPAAACATSADSFTGTTGGTDAMFLFGGGNKYIATFFTAAANETICKATITGSKTLTGGPMNITAEIWTDSSSHPGAIVGSASAAVVGSSFPGSEGTVDFTGMSATLTSGTVYWLVMHADNTSDNSNYPNWSYVSGFVSHGDMVSVGGVTWSDNNNVSLKFQLTK